MLMVNVIIGFNFLLKYFIVILFFVIMIFCNDVSFWVVYMMKLSILDYVYIGV